MLDRLEAMSMLLSVVDTGSFSAASRHRRVPLATVSRKVNELEKHLETRLLIRTTRRVALTDAGARYLTSARPILDEIDETERIATGEFHAPRGELLLTAPVLFGLLHVLPTVTAFLASFPEINVRLMFSDRNLQIVEDHVDVAMRIGQLPNSTMVATRVGVMRTVLCASPKLLATYGEPLQPREVSSLPCVNFEVLSPTSVWPFRSVGGKGMKGPHASRWCWFAPRRQLANQPGRGLASPRGPPRRGCHSDWRQLAPSLERAAATHHPRARFHRRAANTRSPTQLRFRSAKNIQATCILNLAHAR